MIHIRIIIWHAEKLQLKNEEVGYVINIHVETNHNDIDIRQTNINCSFYQQQ